MSEQLALFAGTRVGGHRPRVRLVSRGKGSALPTGFTARPTPRHCDYASADGRWVIEANWWRGGHWCVFDTADAAQRDESRRWLARRYYERGIAYCELPLIAEAGAVVRTLDEARAIIEASPAVSR